MSLFHELSEDKNQSRMSRVFLEKVWNYVGTSVFECNYVYRVKKAVYGRKPLCVHLENIHTI